MKEFWDSRYKEETYAYGIAPNVFLKESLDSLKLSGKMLFPAEGEGRNAVYAAKNGLEAYAFDISEEGKVKATKLAEQEGVHIHYQVGNFFDLDLAKESYDAIALIYAHFPPSIAQSYYPKLLSMMKPGAYLILEGFSTKNLEYRAKNPNIGGPDKLEMLLSMEGIQAVFSELELILLEEKEVELNEGLYHKGTGSVIRFIGRKKA
ncbi:MAG: class I SAM-dependent methyltransferase [Chitinophagales bacterium]|nr:class I SAM-dependent methyltransferase [Chitinophagales bacterium]